MINVDLRIDDDFSDIALFFTPTEDVVSFDEWRDNVDSLVESCSDLKKIEIRHHYDNGEICSAVEPIWDHQILKDLTWEQWGLMENMFSDALADLKRSPLVISGALHRVVREDV